MKLTIDITDEMYQAVKNGMWCGNELWYNALKNGIPHETVTEFADRCSECGREKVLDKIRAEIMQLDYDTDYVDYDYNDMTYTETIHTICREEVIQIIDKCKAESENKE